MGRNLALWAIIIFLLVAVFNMFSNPNQKTMQLKIPYSDFVQQVDQKHIHEVVIKGNTISGKLADGKTFVTDVPPQDPMLVQRLIDKGVRFQSLPSDDNVPSFFHILISWFPMLLLIGVYIFFFRQMQSGGGKAMSFGKSKARMLNEKTNKVTFEDVAGIDEAKDELYEIVDFLKDPQKFQRLGGRIPKGVLLVGPPGTGKTLLARAIAGEADVPFFTISGSDFVEMFVGVGASRVRDMFEQGKKNAPCIIFIDEIDAVGRHRGAGLGGGNDEREQTLNQLLVEMDGFEANEGVILIAATNRPDVLDPALLRPGRFDRQVVVPNPDINGREQILKVHMRKTPLSPDVDARVIARGTPGFSGADLANLVNEAALLAARKGKRSVSMAEFELAKDKVMMGAERKSLAMSDDEKKLTAYHESGHAIIAHFLPDSDPIHKATIIPRGRALGMVVRLPEGDRISMSRSKLLADLQVAMGGRIAEELIFGYDKVTTGASSDIKMASNISRRMITEWGMSDKLGFLSYGDQQQEVFLGYQMTQGKNLSESTAQDIDREVRKVIDDCYSKAEKILKTNLKKLHLLAETLLKYETLSGDEIRELLEKGKIDREPEQSLTSKPKSSIPKSTKSRKKSDATIDESPEEQGV